MLRDNFQPPLFKKNVFFDTRGRCFYDILETVSQLNAPLHFTFYKEKLSELDFWFSSYGHFSGIICKTPSSGQNAISLFFNKNFLNLYLFHHV